MKTVIGIGVMIFYVVSCAIWLGKGIAYGEHEGRIDVASGAYECDRIDMQRNYEWVCLETK